MKAKLFILILMIFLTFTSGVLELGAEEQTGILEDLPIEFSADIAINSKYLWRGFVLDNDPVMQEGIYLGLQGFTVSIWGSFDIDNDDTLNSDEVDYALDYTKEFDNLSLSLGHTYYDFPATDLSSKEFYLGAGWDAFLSPSLTWYHDYGNEASGGGDGEYIILELDHSLPLGATSLSLDLGGHFGYNDALFIKGNGRDVALSAGLTIPLKAGVTLSPSLNCSLTSGDLKDSNDGNQGDEFYSGLTLSFSF